MSFVLRSRGGRQRVYDAQMRHRRLKIEAGHNYTASFYAWAATAGTACTRTGIDEPRRVGALRVESLRRFTTDPSCHSLLPSRLMGRLRLSTAAEFTFHLNDAANVDTKICFDDIVARGSGYYSADSLHPRPCQTYASISLAIFSLGPR